MFTRSIKVPSAVLLLGLALAASADARIASNGISLNGTSLNGKSLNGVSLNGSSQLDLGALRIVGVTLPARTN